MMSSSDLERMMRSRALPEGSPILQPQLQTLQTYGSRMMGGAPLASPSDYSPTPTLGYGSDPLGMQRPIESDVNNMSPINNAFVEKSAPSPNPLIFVSGERGGYNIPTFVEPPRGELTATLRSFDTAFCNVVKLISGTNSHKSELQIPQSSVLLDETSVT